MEGRVQSCPAETADASVVAQETTPLLGEAFVETCSKTTNEDVEAAPVHNESPSVIGIISVLLIGVFVSQADVSLVMATYATIASEFDSLEKGSWLLSSYLLASCVTQPMFGKFSDIFGRKSVLQTCYVLFAIGTAASGLAANMTYMIVGRVVQGAGGAGMVSMVSIILTDLVPLQEVAAYRSYVNIFSTVGRSCGAFLGGYLTQAVGWRWAFLCQIPLLLVSIVLVWWKLEKPKIDNETSQSVSEKLARIDFAGAFFMSLTILPLMLALDLSGQGLKWDDARMLLLLAAAVCCGVIFSLIEQSWAKEPIFPLKLLGSYVVATSYLMLLIQTGIQVALMYLIPLYFQATQNASTGEAGAHLVPSIVGNTVGGLVVGAWIKRTGRYKLPTVLSSLFAMTCFVLLILLWRGHTGFASSLVIFFGGLATGMANSSVFIGLSASTPREDMAIAASGLYLSINIGAVAGVSAAGSIFQSVLRYTLSTLLSRETDGYEVIRKVLSDVKYLNELHGRIHQVVVGAFVSSIRFTFGVALAFSTVGLFIALCSRQTKLTK